MSVVGLTVDDFGGGNLAQIQSSVKYHFQKVLAARMPINVKSQLSYLDSLVLFKPLSILQLDETEPVTITYTYDGLDRLTAADYSNGIYFHYTYDAVGNRLSETTPWGTTNYQYDVANRLTDVGGTAYEWDANGNLLSDGEYTYTYNHANRLATVTDGTNTYSYTYNGDGTRTSSTTNGARKDYVVDIAGSLSQVLSDGEYTYLYGNGCIAQVDSDSTEYFLGDALGSVRQLVDGEGEVTLAQSYEPYGEVLSTRGSGETSYAFTGEEYESGTGLVYLRARYYSSNGRFISSDSWEGNKRQPQTYNLWQYANNNPIMYNDSSGHYPEGPEQPELINPARAARIQQHLSELYNYTDAPGWDQLLLDYPTLFKKYGLIPWWIDIDRVIFCGDQIDVRLPYTKKEIIMGLYMYREFGEMMKSKEAYPVLVESLSRQYWTHCGTDLCHMSNEWVATNAFLNFLSYSQSMADMVVALQTTVFPVDEYGSFAQILIPLSAAFKISKGQAPNGTSGQEHNKPYGWFTTGMDGNDPPSWFIDWIEKIEFYHDFGNQSYSGDGHMQVAYAEKGNKEFVHTLFLTPDQQDDLCGERQSCVRSDLPEPEWYP